MFPLFKGESIPKSKPCRLYISASPEGLALCMVAVFRVCENERENAGVAKDETKGERKPPLTIALCAVLDTAVADVWSVKCKTMFARVGAESERVRGS